MKPKPRIGDDKFSSQKNSILKTYHFVTMIHLDQVNITKYVHKGDHTAKHDLAAKRQTFTMKYVFRRQYPQEHRNPMQKND